MVTQIAAAPLVTSVVVDPRSIAGARYRAGREHAARVPGFPPEPTLDLRFYGGKTIERLTFTHVYLGGKRAWSADDVARIDRALPAAMADRRLNNVLAQYFRDGRPTATFRPSRVLEERVPRRVYRDTIESLVAALERENGLSGFDLATTAFCFLLPRGTVLVDGNRGERGAADSRHGLAGYHGSIHPKHGSRTETVYYAVGVYSEGENGIVVFGEPWQNVCATFYHELCEIRTDADVEDAVRAGGSPRATRFLGWYSNRGGEIGDIPVEEAGERLDLVLREIPLADGSGAVPVQLMWSNAVHGPEGPIARRHRYAAPLDQSPL